MQLGNWIINNWIFFKKKIGITNKTFEHMSVLVESTSENYRTQERYEVLNWKIHVTSILVYCWGFQFKDQMISVQYSLPFYYFPWLNGRSYHGLEFNYMFLIEWGQLFFVKPHVIRKKNTNINPAKNHQKCSYLFTIFCTRICS